MLRSESKMTRIVLKYLVSFFLILLMSKAYAHHDTGGGGVSFFANEAFTRTNEKFAILFLPSYEKPPEEKKIIFPLGFQYKLTDRLLVYGRSNIYEIHYDEEDKRTDGHGDSDLSLYYDFEKKIKHTYDQSFLINFHIPTGEINRHLSDGFLRYEPSYIISYSTPINSNSTFQIFNQVGFVIRQRLKNPTEEAHTHPDAEQGDEHTHEEAHSEDEQELPEEENHVHESHNHHSHSHGHEPGAHSLIWNAGMGLLTKKTQSSIELDWENNRWNNHGLKNDLYLTPRVFFNITKKVQIGLSLPIGLTPTSDDYKILGLVRVAIA